MNKLLVGLTGCPGSGKTAAAQVFREKGAEIIDMDQAGKWVVDNFSVVLNRIVQIFGASILAQDGTLNRSALGNIVFNDQTELEKLNSIVHPFMVNRVRQLLQTARHKTTGLPYLVLDAALIMELEFHHELDFIITISAPLGQRIDRLVKQRGIDKQKAHKMTSMQLSQEIKEKQAHYVLHNNSDLTALRKKIDIIHDLLLQLANK